MGDQIISPCEDDPMGGPRRLPHLTPAPPAQWSQLPVTPPSPLGWSLCGSLSPGPGAPCRAGSLPSLRSRTVPLQRGLYGHTSGGAAQGAFSTALFSLLCARHLTLSAIFLFTVCFCHQKASSPRASAHLPLRPCVYASTRRVPGGFAR